MTKYEYLEGNSDSTEARSFRFSARARFAPVGVHPPARSKSQNATSPTNPNPVQKRASRHSSTRGRASTTLHTHNGVCLRWYGVGREPLGSSGERRARAPAGTSPDDTSRTARRAPREASTAFGGSRRRREPARGDLAGDDRCGASGDVVFSAPRCSLHRDSLIVRVGPRRRPAASARALQQGVRTFTRHVLESHLTLYPLLSLGRFARPSARLSR